MKSHTRTDILNKFVENTLEYPEETSTTLKRAMKDGVFDRWMAYLLIRNSDQANNGSLSNVLVSQFSMQNNQYPKTCTTATDILSHHRFDNRGNSNEKKGSDKPKKDEDETLQIRHQKKQMQQVSRKVANLKHAIAAGRYDT
jgi:anti-sigma28 factor (negative regulator of flagellin synthesis)